MTMTSWAENEIKIACKRENPDWDGKSFDYGCACYQSALKAYKSLLEDEHSGFSFNLTRHVLERLMRCLPLTPITDEDFKDCNDIQSSEDLRKENLASEKQCPRMSSLFRYESIDGTITYHDVDRVQCIHIGDDSVSHFGLVSKIIDELYPITMPYYPPTQPYKIFIEEFLANPSNGDFDTVGVFYGINPKGERFEINRYFTERNGGFVNISSKEYNDLKQKKDENK